MSLIGLNTPRKLLIADLAGIEAKKHQASIGDIREIFRILTVLEANQEQYGGFTVSELFKELGEEFAAKRAAKAKKGNAK